MLLGLIAVLVLMPAAPAAAAIISTAQEIAIGREAAAEVEAEFGVVSDPVPLAAVTSVGTRVARMSSRRDLPWTFRILRTNEVNAISLPGGFIYMTRGMLAFLRAEDELAFVLAHEVAHVDRRHHVALIERNFFFSIVLDLLFGGRGTSSGTIANFVGFLLTRGYSREAEFEADRVGVTLSHDAGFNAAAGLAFMERLRATHDRDPSRVEVLLQTHPALAERIIRVRQLLRLKGYRIGRSAAAA